MQIYIHILSKHVNIIIGIYIYNHIYNYIHSIIYYSYYSHYIYISTISIIFLDVPQAFRPRPLCGAPRPLQVLHWILDALVNGWLTNLEWLRPWDDLPMIGKRLMISIWMVKVDHWKHIEIPVNWGFGPVLASPCVAGAIKNQGSGEERCRRSVVQRLVES